MNRMPDVVTCNELESNLKSRLCESREDFEAKRSIDADQFMVLGFFPHSYSQKRTNAKGKEVEVTVDNPAFVFSSPGLLMNIPAAVDGKPDGLNIMCDGTLTPLSGYSYPPLRVLLPPSQGPTNLRESDGF